MDVCTQCYSRERNSCTISMAATLRFNREGRSMVQNCWQLEWDEKSWRHGKFTYGKKPQGKGHTRRQGEWRIPQNNIKYSGTGWNNSATRGTWPGERQVIWRKEKESRRKRRERKRKKWEEGRLRPSWKLEKDWKAGENTPKEKRASGSDTIKNLKEVNEVEAKRRTEELDLTTWLKIDVFLQWVLFKCKGINSKGSRGCWSVQTRMWEKHFQNST